MTENLNIYDHINNNTVGFNEKEVGDMLYGFSHSDHIPFLPSNKDRSGITFFTKPQLNLTDMNIKNLPGLYRLLTKTQASIGRFVRTTLDPRLSFNFSDPLYHHEKLSSPLVDKFNPFIPILSNTLLSLSGWPDVTVPTFTSSPGLRKEQYTMVDGIFETYDAFDLTATFKNFVNEPLSLLFETWSRVPSAVFEGTMNDYMDIMLANEFSYNTRIYKFIMDESNRFITKVATTGASFPNTAPMASYFDTDRSKSYTGQNEELSITFKSVGAIYNSDLSLLEFNMVAASYNSDVYNLLMGEEHNLVKIDYEVLSLFRGRGYPVIDLETNELCWYINKDSPTLANVIKELSESKENK